MNRESATPTSDADGVAAGTRIQSVARAAQILLWVAEQPHGATVKEIAASQELALATTYHLVNTLVDEGLLAKSDQRRYGLGHGAAILAQVYLRGRSVPESLLGAVRELARRTGETAYLADWGDNNDIRVLASVEGSELVRVAEVASGPYEHGHARSNGKVLLAHAWPEVREAYLRNHPLVQLTNATISDPAKFDRELARVRARGYAIDQEEYAAGISCVAAPVLHDGHVVASLAVSVPAERFRKRRAELVESVRGVAASHTNGRPDSGQD
jgi:IclR family transcriptional regulator, acetate operon repressor